MAKYRAYKLNNDDQIIRSLAVEALEAAKRSVDDGDVEVCEVCGILRRVLRLSPDQSRLPRIPGTTNIPAGGGTFLCEGYADDGFVALVSVQLQNSRDVTTYLIGCRTPDEAKALVRQEYDAEPQVEIIASKLSADDVRMLKLRPQEIRPWH